jgi:hypothetical protein
MACPPDTGLMHLGFRCIMTPDDAKRKADEAAASSPAAKP